MNDAALPADRPPYRAALVVTLVVLAGYVASLAPTVTFWDAGEFIAATKILGIPASARHAALRAHGACVGHAAAHRLPGPTVRTC